MLNYVLASMPYMLLSYRSCAQVKPQISDRYRMESFQGRFQLTKTIPEPQMETQMNLQRWKTIALNTLVAPAFVFMYVFTHLTVLNECH